MNNPVHSRRLIASFAAFLCLGAAAYGCKSPGSAGALKDVSPDQTAPAPAPVSPAIMSQVDKLVGLVAKLRKLPAFPAIKQAATAALQKQVFALVDVLSMDQLESIVDVLIERAKPHVPQFKNLTPAAQKALSMQFADSIAAESAHHNAFAQWSDVEKQLIGIVNGGGNGAPVGDAAFRQDVERLTKTPFVNYSVGPATEDCREVDGSLQPRNVPLATCVLRNGEASFAARDLLFQNATKSLWIDSWAIYNDYTGNLYVDKLIAKKQASPGIDIRVAVDGGTAVRPGYKEGVDRLVSAGIQVVRWRYPEDLKLRGYGLHRKLMVVDHDTDHGAAVIGGMNFGDPYSRLAGEDKDKWRDTDIMIMGADAVQQAAHVFAVGWNRFVGGGKGDLTPIAEVPAMPAAAPGDVTNAVAFVDQEPSAFNRVEGTKTVTDDPIYLMTLRAIQGAQKTIHIANAYYIATQPIENALIAAMKRGVSVQLYSNSKDSVDDPSLVHPITNSMQTLMTAGGDKMEVFLRQGSTVHSKYLVVDGKFGWVGSYNLHPRSYWYEAETVAAFLGDDLGGKVEAMFTQDITDPVECRKAVLADVASDPKAGSDLTDAFAFFFFNLL